MFPLIKMAEKHGGVSFHLNVPYEEIYLFLFLFCFYNYSTIVSQIRNFNPTALSFAKTQLSFDHSECNRIKDL